MCRRKVDHISGMTKVAALLHGRLQAWRRERAGSMCDIYGWKQMGSKGVEVSCMAVPRGRTPCDLQSWCGSWYAQTYWRVAGWKKHDLSLATCFCNSQNFVDFKKKKAVDQAFYEISLDWLRIKAELLCCVKRWPKALFNTLVICSPSNLYVRKAQVHICTLNW